MTGHLTPGKWSVSNGALLRVTTTDKRPIVICGVHRIGSNGGAEHGDPLANAYLIAAAKDMQAALQLHVAYEKIPADRGGHGGPKGKAWVAFVEARDAALARAAGP